MRHLNRTLLLPLLLGLTVAACSGGGGSTPSAHPTNTVSASPTATASADAATASPAAATGRVNANTASVEELQAAFEAAGISNADRWAREVAEYRPYADDPSWAQLRQELSKYNIAPDVLEQIIATLEV